MITPNSIFLHLIHFNRDRPVFQTPLSSSPLNASYISKSTKQRSNPLLPVVDPLGSDTSILRHTKRNMGFTSLTSFLLLVTAFCSSYFQMMFDIYSLLSFTFRSALIQALFIFEFSNIILYPIRKTAAHLSLLLFILLKSSSFLCHQRHLCKPNRIIPLPFLQPFPDSSLFSG